jgi:hypothetical protein
MKKRYAVLVIAIGFIITMMGVLSKIMHYSFAKYYLPGGLIVEILGIAFLIVILIRAKN